MRFIAILALASLLVACSSTTETTTSEITFTKELPISSLPPIDSSALTQDQLYWHSALKEYDQSSTLLVKIPYSTKLSQLDTLPQEAYCGDEFNAIIAEALALNPTSIMAHSMVLMCADQSGDQAAYDQSSNAIGNIASLLLQSGNGESPSSAIFTRELYEGKIILSWAGFEVIDMELTRVGNDWFHKMYAFDIENGTFQTFYSQNNDYFRQLINSASGDKQPDSALAGAFFQILKMTNEPSAYLYAIRQQLQEHNTITELELANQLESPIVGILMAYHALNNNDDDLLYALLDPISDMADVGFAPAEAFVSVLLLSTGDANDTADAVALYRSRMEASGGLDTANIWLHSFMNLEDPQQALQKLLANAPQSEVSVMAEAVIDFYNARQEYPDPINKKLFALINTLANANDPEAQHKAAMGWLNGGWSSELDIPKGLSLLESSALGGSSSGQLDWGFYNATGKFGLTKNREIAMEWYRKAAAQGNPWALYNLGNAYKDGNSVEPDPVQSAEFYRRSWQQGYAPSACWLGYVYQYQFEPARISDAREVYTQVLAEEENDKDLVECVFQAGIIALRHDNDGSKGIPAMERAAELGSTNALFELGVAYFYGHGVEIDKFKAKAWYEKAVEADSGAAAANLGFMYEIGDWVDKDLNKAIELYELSAKLGNGLGKNNLGTFYLQGIAVDQDVEKGMALYREAAEMDVDFALNNLGDEYWDADYVAQDKALACDYYERAYQQGFLNAYMDIGFCYLNGDGKQQDVQKGIEILEDGVAKNDSDSMLELADYYFKGSEEATDTDKALTLYRQALQLGNMFAAVRLGEVYKAKGQFDEAQKYFTKAWEAGINEGAKELAKLYAIGAADDNEIFSVVKEYAEQNDINPHFMIGVEYHFNQDGATNYQKALEYYLLGAQNQHSGSLNNIGELYRNGNGVDKDVEVALRYYFRALEQGSAHAAFNIAQLHEEGIDGVTDLSEAFKYYLISAERGLLDGMYQTGVRLFDGVGIQADKQHGIDWIQKAADKNFKSAIAWLQDNQS